MATTPSSPRDSHTNQPTNQQDGHANYLKGVLLLLTYFFISAAFWWVRARLASVGSISCELASSNLITSRAPVVRAVLSAAAMAKSNVG